MRGHGAAPERRGDVNYIDQLEDDLMDLQEWLRDHHPYRRLIIGGHSSGGGLVIRSAGGRSGRHADGYVLLSPFLKYNAPTMRPGSGGWANANTMRIAGLSMLNMLGIRCFNNLSVIEFNMPEEVRDGTETLSYSYRLNTGYAPANYKKDLRAISQPLLVAAGTDDEAFIAEQFEPEISKYAEAQFALLPHISHMGVVVCPEIVSVLSNWLKELEEAPKEN